ncbi:MAG: glucose-6-phosphate 1-dehydrogenase [Planctomycetaceae bacterium]|nr:MAG: glucose-6-phosphate 1-dehydrogenase [Planctomycetaceae bacterium]
MAMMPEIPEPAVGATVAIFGASGDLTARKLMPALFHLWQAGYLDPRTPIVGVARREKTLEAFREEMFHAVREVKGTTGLDRATWDQFAQRLFYCRINLDQPAEYHELRRQLEAIERRCGTPAHRVIYLATAPELFLPAVESLAEAGLIPDRDAPHWLRVVFEKPFGTDLSSARQLTARLRRLLREDQIYRIDHYLGKDTVQNLLLFRFGNAIFEPLFNRSHVDHVQITVAESQGMERGRGGYYDHSGALRDVLQNHVLQLLCLVAMEPPVRFQADDVHAEKLKVLRALAPGHGGEICDWVVPGQYTAGELQGQYVPGYREEERVHPQSCTETYVAMKVHLDNWRWAGVPFYLRTGKRLPLRVTEIAVQFKLPPLHLFTTVECEGDLCDLVNARPNMLIFRIQPSEGISLRFSTKRPGMQYQIHPVTMDFSYEQLVTRPMPEAYERLLLDVLRGDSTLFMRSDELEAAWEFVTPILEYWREKSVVPYSYQAGSWGPAEADALLGAEGRTWRRPSLRGPTSEKRPGSDSAG